MEYVFGLAEKNDLTRIMEIIGQAKNQMYREGKRQWDDSYPARQHIAADIDAGNGYVLFLSGRVIAYGAIVFSGEPAYTSIQGRWLSDRQFVVLHRLAVADEVKRQGIATRFMEEAENLSRAKGFHSSRIDTNCDNVYMQRILEKRNFIYCGEIFYERGSRMAYEKLI